MKKNILLPLIIILLIIFSCKKENDNELTFSFDKVDGYVQKGPFLNGTAIAISELTSELLPTGKNFPSQILDNKGTFEIRNVALITQYVELKADGFYYNEVKNENSSAQLTLFALADLSQKSSVNVNVLSNLEKSRVAYLISEGGSFIESKKQAQAEILHVFEIEKLSMPESENLDITQVGEDNAILLAVSVILQGYLSVADLSELLANISTDIREDGVLNSQILGETLLNNAKALKLSEIRSNLEQRYEAMGLDITVPAFEKFVMQFIDNTDFEFTGFIEYPATGKYGLNILDINKKEYAAGTYSMKAIIPEGSQVKVKISGQNWFFPAFQDNSGWEYTDWNDMDDSRTFTSIRTGEIDFEILFESYQDSSWSNEINIYVYENEDGEPTWLKKIVVINETVQAITYPLEGNFGDNLLAMENGQTIENDVNYSITAIFASDADVKIRVKMNVNEGDLTWSVDETKIVNWSGIPTNGDEIMAQLSGDSADMPIKFSGAGLLEVQVETFEVGTVGKYLGTKRIELIIQ